MYILSKKHWGAFVYNLVYPGFLGSMIYELVDSSKDAKSIQNYFTTQTIIKIIITLFYCVDYLHLYEDMHEGEKEERRNWRHLLCDVFSSLFFFFAFVFVKLEKYDNSILLLAVIPICFLIYKIRNKADMIFNLVYLILIWASCFYFCCVRNANSMKFLFIFSIASFVTYCLYVFVYYELVSKAKEKTTSEK